MNVHKKLVVGVSLFVLTLAFCIPLETVHAYTISQINGAKFTFADKQASVIEMQVGGDTLRFKRNSEAPNSLGGFTEATQQRYVYQLQGDTNDNCKQGNTGTSIGSVTPINANISIVSTELDKTPVPERVNGDLMFFRDEDPGGDKKCTNTGVTENIRVQNTFGKDLSVPDAEKATAAGAQANSELECEASPSPLSWILCPVINLGVSFVAFVFENFVRPFLEDVPISTNPDDGSYIAWKQFRLIGNIVLVGTLLAVVYAQVRGDR